jgi:hypothetical protein
MEQVHMAYLGALFAVIAIGWLVVIPMVRNSSRLDERMTEQVRRSARLVDECATTLSPGLTTSLSRTSTIR